MISWKKPFKRVLRKSFIILTVVSVIFSSLGPVFMSVKVAKAAASTITESAAPTELLTEFMTMAKANAVVAINTFSLVQASGSAKLAAVNVVIADPNASGLLNTDIASIALRKESGATAGF